MYEKKIFAKFKLVDDKLIFEKFLVDSELIADWPIPILITSFVTYVEAICNGQWLAFGDDRYVKYDNYPTVIDVTKIEL